MKEIPPLFRLALRLAAAALLLLAFASCAEREIPAPPAGDQADVGRTEIGEQTVENLVEGEEIEVRPDAALTIVESRGTFELDVLGDLETGLEGNAVCILLPGREELRLALHPTDAADFPYFFKIAVGNYVGPASYQGELQIDGPQRSWGTPKLIVRSFEEEERPGPGLVISIASDYAGDAGAGSFEGTVRCDPFPEDS